MTTSIFHKRDLRIAFVLGTRIEFYDHEIVCWRKGNIVSIDEEREVVYVKPANRSRSNLDVERAVKMSEVRGATPVL
jgi:hypothetical protein